VRGARVHIQVVFKSASEFKCPKWERADVNPAQKGETVFFDEAFSPNSLDTIVAVEVVNSCH
jgi:hypothetical protein